MHKKESIAYKLTEMFTLNAQCWHMCMKFSKHEWDWKIMCLTLWMNGCGGYLLLFTTLCVFEWLWWLSFTIYHLYVTFTPL